MKGAGQNLLRRGYTLGKIDYGNLYYLIREGRCSTEECES